MTLKLKTVGRDSVEPKLDLRGKKSRLDPDKSGPHRQGQSATCRTVVKRRRVASRQTPSHPVALLPLTIRSHPLKPRRTPSNPVKPGQTKLAVVKNRYFVAFPPPFGNQDTLASNTRCPFTMRHSLFTIPSSQARSNRLPTAIIGLGLGWPCHILGVPSRNAQSIEVCPCGGRHGGRAVRIGPIVSGQTQSNPVQSWQNSAFSLPPFWSDPVKPSQTNPQSAIRNPQSAIAITPSLHHPTAVFPLTIPCLPLLPWFPQDRP
jgi:hypothetical protein